MHVRMFPGGWCRKENVGGKTLVTTRPKIEGRESYGFEFSFGIVKNISKI